MNSVNCWKILRAYSYYNVTGNGKRDSLKKLRIGQSAAKPLANNKLREGSETDARQLKCYKESPVKGRVRRAYNNRLRYSPCLDESLGLTCHTDGFRYDTLKVLDPGEVYFLGAPANLGAITRRKDLSTAPINLNLRAAA